MSDFLANVVARSVADTAMTWTPAASVFERDRPAVEAGPCACPTSGGHGDPPQRARTPARSVKEESAATLRVPAERRSVVDERLNQVQQMIRNGPEVGKPGTGAASNTVDATDPAGVQERPHPPEDDSDPVAGQPDAPPRAVEQVPVAASLSTSARSSPYDDAPRSQRRADQALSDPSGPFSAARTSVEIRHAPPASARRQVPVAPPRDRSATAVTPVITIARGEPGRPVAEPSAPTAPPPSVRITIGRVEVRAVSPPPPARKEYVAAPRLSLDEYLRPGKRGSR